MIRLCGFQLSNYHNKVRLALLEKGIPFEEDADCKPSQEEAYLAKLRASGRTSIEPIATSCLSHIYTASTGLC